jgi:hypothetical protein
MVKGSYRVSSVISDSSADILRMSLAMSCS